MFQWVQMASLCSCAIAHHLERKERSREKTIAKLKKELVKLKEFHTEEIRLLEEKVIKAEDKYLAGQQDWGAKQKEVKDKVTFLEKKVKEHEEFYTIEVAELNYLLKAKTQYANDLKGEAVEQYIEGFDEALRQVAFLYAHLDVSYCRYFKEIQDEKFMDKLPPKADAIMGDQSKTLGEEHVDGSPTSSQFLFFLVIGQCFPLLL